MEHGALSPSSQPAMLDSLHLRGNVPSDGSPAYRSQSSVNSDLMDISPVTARSANYDESICVDGTGTRLMMESFLEVSNQQDRTAGPAVSTIFPSNSLLLAGIANDTIIEHEGKPVCEVSEASSSLNSSRGQADPVIKWWMELFMSTEPECMTYLQSKPIMRSKEPTPVPATPLAFYPYEMIKTTLVAKRAVLVTFSLLKR